MGQLVLLVLSAALLLLNASPVWWQLRQGNSGPVCMGIWVMILNFDALVNTSIFFDNATDRAPVWCDISIKLQLAGQVGRIASIMAIARFLAAVVNPRATAVTARDLKHRAIFDYMVSFGVPFVVGACHIVYQPDRYLIVRGLGCAPTNNMTWPTLILWMVWSPIFAITGTIYMLYVFYRLVKHRRDFARVVAGGHSALTRARFIRLTGLAAAYLAIGLPLSLYSPVSNIKSSGAYFDYSWAYLHSTWDLFPVLFVQDPVPPGLSTWSNVIAGALYFVFFGLGAEALGIYRKAADTLRFTPGRWCSALLKAPSRDENCAEVDRDIEASGASSEGAYAGPYRVMYHEGSVREGIKVVIEQQEAVL